MSVYPAQLIQDTTTAFQTHLEVLRKLLVQALEVEKTFTDDNNTISYHVITNILGIEDVLDDLEKCKSKK